MLKKLTLVITMIIIVAQWGTAFGQNYNNEILTMFTRGTIAFPEGKTTAIIKEIDFTPKDIADTILKYSGASMTMAFPDYKREDSIFVSPRNSNLRVRQMELDLIYKIYLDNAAKRDSLNQELENFDEVLFSQNNGTADINSEDPFYYRQWGLNNDDVSEFDIDAPEAWELESGGSNMSIGILDNGVELNHEDLYPKVSGDNTYFQYHGTHVAGIAAANTNNSLGVAGTNQNAVQ